MKHANIPLWLTALVLAFLICNPDDPGPYQLYDLTSGRTEVRSYKGSKLVRVNEKDVFAALVTPDGKRYPLPAVEYTQSSAVLDGTESAASPGSAARWRWIEEPSEQSTGRGVWESPDPIPGYELRSYEDPSKTVAIVDRH